MRRVSRRIFFVWAALGALAAGCISPTLPLPPPSPPDVVAIGQGQYQLTGSLPVQGTVIIVNTRTSLLYGQANTYLYKLDVAAHEGDVMALWYEVDDVQSDSASFTVTVPEIPDAGTTSAKDAGPDAR